MNRKTVITELLAVAKMYRISYKSTDGHIHEKHALKTIAALEEAIRLLKTKKP